VADKTIASHPDLADGYLWRGTAEANQKHDGAQADFEMALKKDPNNATAYLELGQLHLRQGQLAEGKALLEQAIAHDPNMLQALEGLVGYDLAAKDPAKAQARIEAQIAKAPGNAGLYAMLSALELHLKNFSGSRDSAAKAMQLSPSNRQAVELYAQSEAALGNSDQAIATWKQWSDARRGDYPGHDGRREGRFRQGNGLLQEGAAD
jgi:tetratricopeptide (TPR) repeat protein